MPRVCTVCGHKYRDEMDILLVQGKSKARIASLFGLKEYSVRNHFKKHVPEKMLKSSEATDLLRADELVLEVRRLKGEVNEILVAAKGKDSLTLALASIDRLARLIELQAKLIGLLRDNPTINIGVLNNPEWVQIKAIILEATEPFPKAQEQILSGLRKVPNLN